MTIKCVHIARMSWVGISVTSDSAGDERKVLTTDSRKQDLGGAKPIIMNLCISRRNQDTTILLVILVTENFLKVCKDP